MDSRCLQRLCSAGRHGRNEALMVASPGDPSDPHMRKHARYHVKSAANAYKETKPGYISVSDLTATAKRRRSECFKEPDWAMDSDQRPMAKRVHNASKENSGIPSRTVEHATCDDTVAMEGIGPGFMRLAMGLVLPLNLDSVHQIPNNRRKLSEHERQANARKLLDEELSKRLQLAVSVDSQSTHAHPLPHKAEHPASTTQSTSPSDLADAAIMHARDYQTCSCESSHMH